MNLEPVRRIGLNTLFRAAILLFAEPGLAQQQFVPNAAILETEEPPVPEYAVEMIVFEYAGSVASTTEVFAPNVEVVDDLPPPDVDFSADIPAELPVDQATMADELPHPDDTDVESEVLVEPAFVLFPGETLEEIPTYESQGIRLIPPEEYQLQSAWNRLEQLAAYRPLMHTAWIQPTVDQEATKAFPLRRIGDPPLRLDGTVSLYLSRFLHIAVDLSIEHKAPQNISATGERGSHYGDSGSRAALSFDPIFITPSTFYRIEEDRIMRNNELRYFDHPKFGVLAKITRIEQEVLEDLDMTDDLLPGNTIQ